MACPFFYPVARLENDGWAISPRLPLGDAYAGECRAGEATFQPDEARLRQTCNLGYGRNTCDRFPQSAQADAVRFHVAEEAGGLIRIQYVFERDCWPVEHGVLECSAGAREPSPQPENELLGRQAAVYVESYMRRRE